MVDKLFKFFYSAELRTFSILSLFHISLYFSTSNKVTFLFSFILLLALYQHLKKLPLTLFYVFLTMLPFAKGKGIDILLLDKRYVTNVAFFDLSYFFPLYFSLFYLGLFYIYTIRKKLFFRMREVKVSKQNKIVISIFMIFILIACFNSIYSIFEIPVFLSSIQLIELLFIFFIPFILHTFYKKLNDFYMVIASSTLFQSVWLMLQTLNKGHLNKDIEVFLFSSKVSIQSSENSNLLRLPGTFFESSILGTFIITNISILILYLINNHKIEKNKKLVLLATIIAGIVAIILTGSRAIYLILFVILLIIAKVKRYLSIEKMKKVILLFKRNKIIIPIIIAISIFVGPFFISRISSSNQVFSKEGSGSYRVQLSKYALRLTERKTWFGVGLNLSQYYLATSFPRESIIFDAAYPHNIIIQLLAETGIIGASLFVIFIYLIFRPLLLNKNSKISPFHLGALAFLMCSQFYPIFINHMEIISYLFLYLGFATFYNQKDKYEK